MKIEELLAKLVAGSGDREIKLLQLSSPAVGLTDAQQALFPTVKEIVWPLMPGTFSKEKPCDVVVLLPDCEWPDGFLPASLYEDGAVSIHLCISSSLLDNLGFLLQHISSDRVAVKSIASFESLGLSCVLELVQLSSLSDGYISYALSESVFVRAQNRRRSDLLDEKEESLTSELAVLKLSHEKLAGELRSTKNKLANVSADLVYNRDRHRRIKDSFSYRFGNIFALSAKSPRRLMLLPFTILAFLLERVIKKSKVILTKKKTPKKKQLTVGAGAGKSKSVVELDPHELTLAQYLSDPPPAKTWIALISSDWLQQRLAGCGEFIQLQPNDWPAYFSEKLPDRLLVDSLDLLDQTAWRSCLQGGAYGYPNKLNELLNYCHSRGVETVLWHSAAPETNRVVADMASQFSKIYVADQLEYRYLRDIYNVASEKIAFMPLALDGRRCATSIEQDKNHIPKIVVSGVDEMYVELIKAVYADVLKQKGVSVDQAKVLVSAEDLQAGDLCWVPSYAVASGYLSERFFEVLERGAIPFTSSMSAANSLFGEAIALANDELSITVMIEKILDSEESSVVQQKLLYRQVLEQYDFNECSKKLLAT